MALAKCVAVVVALAWCTSQAVGAASAQSSLARSNAGGLSPEAEQIRKRNIDEADRKLEHQNADARRAMASMCSGCGERELTQQGLVRPEPAYDRVSRRK